MSASQPVVQSIINSVFQQQQAPITQLPIDLFEHLFSFLKGENVACLEKVCRIFQVLGNENALWRQLFERNFPYHKLTEEMPSRKQYKERYLTERNWNQDRCQIKTMPNYARGVVHKFSLFNNLIISIAGGSDSFIVYEKNTLQKLYMCEERYIIDIENFHDDGDFFITQANEGPTGGVEIRVWEKANGKHICRIRNGLGFVAGKSLIFGNEIHYTANGLQKRLVVWDKITGNCRHILDPNSSGRAMDTDGVYFYAIVGELIKAWLASDGSFAGSFECENNDSVVAFLSVDNELVSSHKSGVIRIWSKQERKCIRMFSCPIRAQGYHRLMVQGEFLVGEGQENHGFFIDVWNLEEKSFLYTVRGLATYAFSDRYIFSQDVLYVALDTGFVEGLDKKTGEVQFRLQTPIHEKINKIAISGARFFAFTDNFSREYAHRKWCLQVWDLPSKALLKVIDKLGNFYVEDDCIFGSAVEAGDAGVIKMWDFCAYEKI